MFSYEVAMQKKVDTPWLFTKIKTKEIDQRFKKSQYLVIHIKKLVML